MARRKAVADRVATTQDDLSFVVWAAYEKNKKLHSRKLHINHAGLVRDENGKLYPVAFADGTNEAYVITYETDDFPRTGYLFPAVYDEGGGFFGTLPHRVKKMPNPFTERGYITIDTIEQEERQEHFSFEKQKKKAGLSIDDVVGIEQNDAYAIVFDGKANLQKREVKTSDGDIIGGHIGLDKQTVRTVTAMAVARAAIDQLPKNAKRQKWAGTITALYNKLTVYLAPLGIDRQQFRNDVNRMISTYTR